MTVIIKDRKTRALSISRIPQSSTAQPFVARPGIPQPAVVQTPQLPSQPFVGRPGIPQPSVARPTATFQPSIPQPQTNIPQPSIPQPSIPQPSIPQPQTNIPQPAAPEQVLARNIPQPARTGGLVRQFGGRTSTITTESASVASPLVILQEETGIDMLNRSSSIWNGTQQQIMNLSNLTYQDGMRIIDPSRKDIMLEIIGMLKSQPYESVISFLSNATSPDYVLWEQPSLDEGRNKILREISIQQVEETGIKGIGKCRYCPSTELVYAQKQLRSGDEPATVFVRCVMCHKQWRQG